MKAECIMNTNTKPSKKGDLHERGMYEHKHQFIKAKEYLYG